MTYREFLRWVWFLEWEEAEAPATRLDYYLAQIAAEVHRTAAKHPGQVSVQSKLCKFALIDREPSSDEREAHIKMSKAFWRALAFQGAKPLPPKVKCKTQEAQRHRK
jgi:hypothetical protein